MEYAQDSPYRQYVMASRILSAKPSGHPILGDHESGAIGLAQRGRCGGRSDWPPGRGGDAAGAMGEGTPPALRVGTGRAPRAQRVPARPGCPAGTSNPCRRPNRPFWLLPTPPLPRKSLPGAFLADCEPVFRYPPELLWAHRSASRSRENRGNAQAGSCSPKISHQKLRSSRSPMGLQSGEKNCLPFHWKHT